MTLLPAFGIRKAAAAVVVACLAASVPLMAQSPSASVAAGGPSLAGARDLYDAAAYADALAMLDGLPSKDPAADVAIEIGKYRAFCLVALGRASEAQEAIAAILMARPSFRLSENDVSRRIYTVFEETRQRVLPQAVQRVYERAKAAYDRQQFQQARDGFSLVVALAEQPGNGAGYGLVKDMGTLARGFLNLIAATAPPVSSKPLALGGAPPPATKYVYDANDSEVVPPVAIEQRVPPWPSALRPQSGATGVVEVIISERGEVESAMMAPAFNSAYDELLLAAARTWRYRPATCARQPVKYRRRVQIVAGGPPDPSSEHSAEHASREDDATNPAAR